MNSEHTYERRKHSTLRNLICWGEPSLQFLSWRKYIVAMLKYCGFVHFERS